jgi:hypothetical protein
VAGEALFHCQARQTFVELAWFWLRYQPQSKLARWWLERFENQGLHIWLFIQIEFFDAPIESAHLGEMDYLAREHGVTSFKIFMFYGGYGLHGKSAAQNQFLMLGPVDRYDIAHFEFVMRGARSVMDSHPDLPRALAIPLRQRAILLEQQEPPRQLDHATSHTGIARSGHTFLATRGAAPVGRACQPSVARDRPAIAHVPQEQLVHKQVGGLDADAGDACQQAHHGMRLGVGCPLQTLKALLLNSGSGTGIRTDGN